MSLFLRGTARNYGRIGGNGLWGRGRKAKKVVLKAPLAVPLFPRPASLPSLCLSWLIRVRWSTAGQRDDELSVSGVFAHRGMAAEAPFIFPKSLLMQQVGARVLVSYSIFKG